MVYIYFNLFNLPVSLHLGWVSQRDYIIWPSFYIPSHMFSHLMGTLRLLNFKVIIALLGLSSTIHVTVFYFLPLLFVCEEVSIFASYSFTTFSGFNRAVYRIPSSTHFTILNIVIFLLFKVNSLEFSVHIYVGGET